MSSLQRLSVLAAMAAIAVAGSSGTAAAMRHNKLVRAVPGVDSTVKAPPREIRLWFKEPADVAVSSIKLADAVGKDVTLGPVKATTEAVSIVAEVPGALAGGAYTVTWKTASKDGHIIRGSYRFTVSP